MVNVDKYSIHGACGFVEKKKIFYATSCGFHNIQFDYSNN